MENKRAQAFAARYVADEGDLDNPTDEALAAAFAQCVRPAPRWLYPAIRKALQAYKEVPRDAMPQVR